MEINAEVNYNLELQMPNCAAETGLIKIHKSIYKMAQFDDVLHA